MPAFRVQLISGDNAVVERRVDAADAFNMASLLGVTPDRIVSVVADGRAGTRVAADELPRSTRRRGRAFPLRLFCHELSVLIGAGLPLLEGVVTLREKESSALVIEALGAVVDQLREGERFSVALGRRPEAFDALFVAIVASAEKTGQLEEALLAHARYLAWTEELGSQLRNACIYPALLIVAGTSVLLFLLVFVVPRFAGLLEGMNGDIPAASRLLIDLGAVTGEHPLLTLGAGALLLASPWLAWQDAHVRAAIERGLWRVPGLGSKLRLLALARFYRTMGMLIGAGVPVVAALEIARDVIAARLRPALDGVREAVSRGERFSVALERAQLSTPVSVRMVRVGERSGEMGSMLARAATFYDEELTRLADVVSRLVNPLLMLLMGGVIGTVIVLMYLPIFQLVEQVQ